MKTANAMRGRVGGFVPYVPFGTIVAILALLIIYPVGMLVYTSFVDSPPRPGDPTGSWTIENFERAFSAGIRGAFFNSLWLALGGTALAVALGATLAWLSARTDVPFKPLVQLAGVTPLFIPILVGVLSWSALGSPRAGYVNIILRDLGVPFTFNIYSPAGIIFLDGLYYAPYVFLMVNSALVLMDPEQEEAGTIHGAGMFRVMRTITFPLVTAAILGSALLIFTLMLEGFTVAQIIGKAAGIEMVPSLIYRLVTSPPQAQNVAAAIGVTLTVIVFALIFIQRRLVAGKDYSTIRGKGFKPRTISLGRWGYLGTGLAGLYLLLALVLPYFALFTGALRGQAYIANTAALFDFSSISLEPLRRLLEHESFQVGLRNSLLLGVLVAIIGGALHLWVSYTANRTRLRGRGFLEYVMMAPLPVPGIVLGLGFLWAWIVLPLPLYGTLAILALAFVAKFAPQGYQGVTASINQVHADLEDSAYMCGASRFRSFLQVTLPLIRTGVVSTMLLLFILSFRELSASILLYTTESRVLAVVLYESWGNGNWPRTALISLVYSGVLIIVTLLGRKWLNLRST